MNRNRPLPLAPAGVFLLALALRLWHLASIRALPSFENPYSGLDAELYVKLGREIAGGNLFPAGLVDAAPLYAMWLGAIFRVPGSDLLCPRLAQALLGAVAALLVWKIAKDISGPKAALVAGIVAAAYPPFIMYEGTLQSAALVPFLSAALVFLLLRARDRAGTAAAAGFLFGVSTLNRPDLLPLLLVLPVWFLFQPAGRRGAFLFVAGALVLLAPFAAFSSSRSGGFVPVSAHGGIHFYIGNHEGADGTLSPVEGIRPSPEGFARDARAVARRETGADLTPAGVSRHWTGKGLERIRADFGGWFRLVSRKAFLFWNDYEIPNNEDIYFLKRFSVPLRIPTPLFGLVASFAIFGLLFGDLRRGSRSLLAAFVLLGFAVALLFFVTGRYRLPVATPLILIAGAGAIAFAGALRGRRPAAAILLPLLALTLFPAKRFDFAAPETRLASSFVAAGDPAGAEAGYRRALEIRPGFDEARRGLANVYALQGRSEEAAALFREAARSPRGGRLARNDLAVLLAGEGKIDDATAILDELIREDSTDAVALGNLAGCRMTRGDDRAAAALLEKVILLDPAGGEPYLNLALIRTRENRLGEAIALFEKHLEIDPESKKGLFNGGAAYAMHGDLTNALRLWERLEKLEPGYPNLAANIARAHAMLRQSSGRK